MHSEYKHPSIQLYMMSLKPSGCRGNEIEHVDEVESDKTKQIKEDNNVNRNIVDEVFDEKTLVKNLDGRKISEWEARRYGAMAARLLRDVKIT